LLKLGALLQTVGSFKAVRWERWNYEILDKWPLGYWRDGLWDMMKPLN